MSSVPSLGDQAGGEFMSGSDPARHDDRHFSVQSLSQESGSIGVRSMRKFDNGTKFREGLTY